jgi:hypothetical protein
MSKCRNIENSHRSNIGSKWKEFYRGYQKLKSLTQEGMMKWAQHLLDTDDWKYGRVEVDNQLNKTVCKFVFCYAFRLIPIVFQVHHTWQHPAVLYMLKYHRERTRQAPHHFGRQDGVLALILTFVSISCFSFL